MVRQLSKGKQGLVQDVFSKGGELLTLNGKSIFRNS